MTISLALCAWLTLAGVGGAYASVSPGVPDDATLSFDEFTTVDDWGAEEPLDDEVTPDDIEAVIACRAQLEQVALAIRAFRETTDESYPLWLSALVPDFLPDGAMLLCPADAAGGDPLSAKARDPHLPVSYLYELPPSEYEARRSLIRQFGGMVPIVRCLHHLHVPLSAVVADPDREGETTLSVTEDLRVDAGAPEWKDDAHVVARVYEEMLADIAKPDAAALEGYPFGVMKLLSREQLAGVEDAMAGVADRDSYRHMGAYHKLAGAYYARMNRTADAIDSYRRAADMLPENAEVRFALGVLHGTLGDADRSIRAFEEGLRLQPDTVDVTLTLARHYSRERRDDDLRRIYGVLRSHFRRDSLVHNYAMGTVAYLVDDLQASREAFERVLRDLPPSMSANDGIPRYAIRRLASIYERQGDPDGANVLRVALDNGMTQVGQVGADIEGETTSGGPVSLSDYDGQVTVVAFWRSDNAACRAQLAYLESLRRELGGGFTILAVNVAGPEAGAREKLYATANIPGPTVLGAVGFAQDYAITSVPTAVALDRERVVRYRHVGHEFEDERDIERHVRGLLADH